MNTLQKKAWAELAVMSVCVIVATAGLAVMVRLDTKGIAYIAVVVAAMSGLGVVAYVRGIKSGANLDEREQSILSRAWTLATHAFVFSIGCVSFTAFFMVGGGGSVPVYMLPATLVGALFVAQFVQSAAILIQFAKEQVDE